VGSKSQIPSYRAVAMWPISPRIVSGYVPLARGVDLQRFDSGSDDLDLPEAASLLVLLNLQDDRVDPRIRLGVENETIVGRFGDARGHQRDIHVVLDFTALD
jgi:hypothetical protein